MSCHSILVVILDSSTPGQKENTMDGFLMFCFFLPLFLLHRQILPRHEFGPRTHGAELPNYRTDASLWERIERYTVAGAVG